MLAVRSDLSLSSAGALFLKASALVLMVVDHYDWFLRDGALGLHSTVGRAVFPAFAIVLALNLTRMSSAACFRAFDRMLLVGLVSSVPYVFLQGSTLPANILFTLALSVLVVWIWNVGLFWLAVLTVAVFGFFVDYAWYGVLAVVLPFALLRRGASLLLASMASAAIVSVWNGSLWALLVVPLVGLAASLPGDAPRLKWLFYLAYPAHLVVLLFWPSSGL